MPTYHNNYIVEFLFKTNPYYIGMRHITIYDDIKMNKASLNMYAPNKIKAIQLIHQYIAANHPEILVAKFTSIE